MTPACLKLDKKQIRTQNKDNFLKKSFAGEIIGIGSLRAETCLLLGESDWGDGESEVGRNPALWALAVQSRELDLTATHRASCEPNTGFIESKIIQEDWQCGSVGRGPCCADPVT